MKRPVLILALLVVVAFSLGTSVQPRMVRTGGAHDSENVFKVLLGEGRRMFANHFAVKADVYMHSGFYPSIFDQAAEFEKEEAEFLKKEEEAVKGHVHTAECNHDHDHEHEHDEESCSECQNGNTSFMGKPKDWFEAMGRHFMVSDHTHLKGGSEREILPWLELSAELDPQRIETYVVTAYWLADRLGKPEEAEQFLRQGLKANPLSYEILFELGKLYDKHLNQPERARNVWLLALRRWDEVEAAKEDPDHHGRERIFVYLGNLEAQQGNYLEAVRWFQEAKKHSPSPEAIEERIKEIWLKFTLPPATP